MTGRHGVKRAPVRGGLSSAFSRWWGDGPLHRPGARRRYGTMLLVLVVLAAAPAVIAALPVSVGTASSATLLARVKASGSIPYTGLASVSGQLAVPDLGIVGREVTNLLTSTTRVRVWWAGSTRYRVDQQSVDGEVDIYRNGATTWNWDSSTRLALRSTGPPQYALPAADDVLPGTLARRLLSQADPAQVTVGGAARIARHDTRVLIWRPDDPRSLIAQVKVWVDPETGFPYGVEIRAVGGEARAYSSSFLDVSLDPPAPDRLAFDPTKDPTAVVQDDGDGRPRGNGLGERLPATLGGLPQRSPQTSFYATYGTGASVVAVGRVPSSATDSLRSNLDTAARPPITGQFGEGSLISTSLLTGLIFSNRGSGYVLLGTVTRAELEAIALDLVQARRRS